MAVNLDETSRKRSLRERSHTTNSQQRKEDQSERAGFGDGDDLERAHHFHVFVFQDVAVPDKGARVLFEFDHDSRGFLRANGHGVFPAQFVVLKRKGLTNRIGLRNRYGST